MLGLHRFYELVLSLTAGSCFSLAWFLVFTLQVIGLWWFRLFVYVLSWTFWLQVLDIRLFAFGALSLGLCLFVYSSLMVISFWKGIRLMQVL